MLEVEVPDDDMGPVLEAQSKLDEEIAAGDEKPATPLRPTSSPRPTPSTATRLRPADRLEGRDGREQARRQGDGRLQRRGPQGLPDAEPGSSGPGPRSAPGSSAARPGWPTSCSAT